MDTIDRQAAIDALADMHCKSDEDGYVWIIRSDAWARIDALPSMQPSYTDEEIQKMQDLHQAEVEKAFELGREDAKSECETGHWIPDRDCYSEMRFVCSQCQKSEAVPTTRFMDYYKPIWNFCPHCGARMWG